MICFSCENSQDEHYCFSPASTSEISLLFHYQDERVYATTVGVTEHVRPERKFALTIIITLGFFLPLKGSKAARKTGETQAKRPASLRYTQVAVFYSVIELIKSTMKQAHTKELYMSMILNCS